MTQTDLLREMTARLKSAGVPDASFDAKQLLLSLMGYDTSSFLLHSRDDVDPESAKAAFALVSRRVSGEPLQYLVGTWSFLDETFEIGPGVLIPRPETEELVLLCERKLYGIENPVIYDLCAGSGCIGLSLQKRLQNARVVLIEYSVQALRYLRKNAEKLADFERTDIIRGDVLCGAAAFGDLSQADLIVSNPPYIPSGELADLQREVQMEPRMALDGGEDGLLFYHCFSSLWTDALKADGCFVFECGDGQGEQVADLFRSIGFSAEALHDFNGFDRFVTASRGRKDPYDF